MCGYSDEDVTSRELISASRLAWLRGEIAGWRGGGLVGHSEAKAIEADVRTSLRARGARTVMLIGAALLGIGLIGVVAGNLDVDEIGPLERSLLVGLVWLALVALAEVVDGRGALHALANPIALLAAIAYGATIFQVTQSLQVPAFEPSLILAWALGALVYAYATSRSGPLVLGVGALVGWYVWELSDRTEVAGAIVLGTALAMPLTAAVAAFHEGTRRAPFTGAWRFTAALLGLGALAVAVVAPLGDPPVPGAVIWAAIPIGFVALVALARGDARQRIEIAGALVVAGATIALVALAPHSDQELFFFDEPPDAVVTFKLVAVGLYIVLASALAYLGAVNGAPAMTGVGVGAIVLLFASQVFTFGLVLANISTAWLLLALGGLLTALGVLADVLHRRAARS
jgi:uncharacterized membrane protein